MLPNKAASTCNECLPHGSAQIAESSPLAMVGEFRQTGLQALRANIWRPALASAPKAQKARRTREWPAPSRLLLSLS